MVVEAPSESNIINVKSHLSVLGVKAKQLGKDDDGDNNSDNKGGPIS